jgi:zinc protease
VWRERIWAGAAAIVTLAAGCILDVPPAVPVTQPVQTPRRTLVLGSGLRVVLEQAPDYGAAAVVSAISAGAADDPAGKRGLAHFVEHLTVQSSHNGVSFRDATLERRANATTGWDDTTYHAVTDPGALEQTVAVAYDAVVDPLGGVDDAAFQRQKRIVENEVRFHQVEETPADEALWAAVFPAEDPYSLPIAGTVESVDRLSWQDVRAFTAAHYQPARAVLVVVAPSSLDDQQRMIERITGDRVETATPPATPSVESERPAADRAYSYTETRLPVATPRLLIGWALPSSPHANDLAELVTRMVRGLTFELHSRDPDLSSVDGQLHVGTRANLLTLRVILKDGTHPERTARLVLDEVKEGFEKLGFQFQGFESLKSYYGSEVVYEQESLLRRAIDAAQSTLTTGVPSFLAGRGERILALGSADVVGYVHRYVSPDLAHVVLIHPGEPPALASDAGRALAVAALRTPEAASGPPARVAVVPAAAPPAPNPLLGGLETHTLSNGLTVVLFRRPGSLFHTVLLGFRGGLAQASPPGVTVATAWARLWSKQPPAVFGIVHRDWSDDNNTVEELHGLGSNVSATLERMRDQLGFSVFWPPKNFTDRVKVWQSESEMPEQVLARLMAPALYADQPLGKRPTAEEIQRITPAEVNKWLSRVRQPSNALLVIVGDFDPAAALAAAEKHLGNWWGRNGAPTPPPVDPPPHTELGPGSEGKRIFFAHQPGAAHATLRFDCLLPPTTPENWAARRIFLDGVQDAVLGELRENLGSTYGVSGRLLMLRSGTATFELATDIDERLLPEALRWLRANVAGPGRGFVGRDRLGAIKASAIRSYQLDGATSAGWANYLLGNWSHNWPLDLHDKVAAAIAGVPPEEVDQLADHCRANGVVGLLGNEPRLRRAWDDATR